MEEKNKKEKDPIPYYAFECVEAAHERRHRRNFIIIIILIIVIIASNVGWLVYESQFDTLTYSQDGSGVNSVNWGTQGDVVNEPNNQN